MKKQDFVRVDGELAVVEDFNQDAVQVSFPRRQDDDPNKWEWVKTEDVELCQ